MRIKCIVTYDGTHFYGWQIQPDKRTVQEEIQKAIYKITHEEVTIHSSGRTDAGVHAVGQVFHFDINKEIPEKQTKSSRLHTKCHCYCIPKRKSENHSFLQQCQLQ